MLDSKLNEKLLSAISSIALTLTVILVSQLWGRVNVLEERLMDNDKELATYLLMIENRMTTVETELRIRLDE